MKQQYKAGYLFKRTHQDLHYMRNAKIDMRKNYIGNFTTDKEKAYIFDSKEDFVSQLQAFLDKSNGAKKYNDYDYYFVMAYDVISAQREERVLEYTIRL